MFPRIDKSSFYASHETSEKIEANPADRPKHISGTANFAGNWSMPTEKAKARQPAAPLSACKNIRSPPDSMVSRTKTKQLHAFGAF